MKDFLRTGFPLAWDRVVRIASSNGCQAAIGVVGLAFGAFTWVLSQQSATAYERQIAQMQSSISDLRAELGIARDQLSTAQGYILEGRDAAARLRMAEEAKVLRSIAAQEAGDTGMRSVNVYRLFADLDVLDTEDGRTVWAFNSIRQAIVLPDGKFLLLVYLGDVPVPMMGGNFRLAILDQEHLELVEKSIFAFEAGLTVEGEGLRLWTRHSSLPDPSMLRQYFTCHYTIELTSFRLNFDRLDLENSRLADAPCRGTDRELRVRDD